MPINQNLLIAAPMLQDYIVDKDTGGPLSGGIVSMYVDTDRQVYKNWYYQTGVPGAYTYIPLDNPLRLSSVGTITDPNGNDVIPFYYPFDESDENIPQAYYVTVYAVDTSGSPTVLQFTRENFPFEPEGSSPTSTVPSLDNYLINNVFWRNAGEPNVDPEILTSTIDVTNVTDMIICPDQHDGFRYPDVRFIKSATGASDTISFVPFKGSDFNLDNEVPTPEYYLQFTCTASNGSETQKVIQYPLSYKIGTLANTDFTFAIQAANLNGAPNGELSIYIFQDLGTNAVSPVSPILKGTITLTAEFQKYTISGTFPDNADTTPSLVGDDALYIQIGLPVGVTCDVAFTKPQLYLSTDIPDNEFKTYDQIDAIINTPRTGDIKLSLNTFCPYGYVPCNDGTIGNAASAATTRANVDTWQLYNMIWNQVPDAWAAVSGGRGLSAYADFTDDKPLALTKTLGRVLAGASGLTPLSNIGPATPTAPATTEQIYTEITVDDGTDVFTWSTASDADFYLDGGPVILTVTGSGVVPAGTFESSVYYIGAISGATFKLYTTVESAIAGGGDQVNVTGTGTSPFYVQTAAGATNGNSNYTLLANDLPEHVHSGPGNDFALLGSGSNWHENVLDPTGHPSSSDTGNNVTQNNPISLLQPTAFFNVFMKL